MSGSPIGAFVDLALEQAGERYVYGAEVRLSDPNPAGPWDCSELTQWASYRASLGKAALPDGSAAQLDFCRRAGTTITPAYALVTRGALLFIQTASHRHVAISLGDGRTIEARGAAYGVATFTAAGRPWTHGARVPGFTYTAPEVGSMTREELIDVVKAALDTYAGGLLGRVDADTDPLHAAEPWSALNEFRALNDRLTRIERALKMRA